MCLFTSALRASVNKSHIPSLPQNNLYLFTETEGNSVFCGPEIRLGQQRAVEGPENTLLSRGLSK
jgi:hypothetical protein